MLLIQGPPMTGRPRASRTGLAEQVAGHLLHDITEGIHPAGEQLPPEPVLAEAAGVSRLTLREAVKSLAQRGVLRVEQGRDPRRLTLAPVLPAAPAGPRS